MRIAVLLGIGVFVTLTFAGCSAAAKADEGKSAYHKISGEEAKEMMNKGGVTVLDVRTAEEYADGYVPSAINLPVEEIGAEQPELLPDKEATLLVYCRSGRRSKAAADKLVDLGYTKVYDFGGIIDWAYETVKGEE